MSDFPNDSVGVRSPRPSGRLFAVIVTFDRPVALAVMLEKIESQTQSVEQLFVVDNGSNEQSRALTEAAGAVYIDAGGNLGPAGGIALGMTRATRKSSDDDWILLLDDDDPPSADDLFEKLLSFALVRYSADPHTAGVGLVGSRYDRRLGIFRRLSDAELAGPVSLDYIGGNQLPMYRCSAIGAVGVFDKNLFFGFEEAEYGLRLRRAGYSLWADGEIWLAQRALNRRLNMDAATLMTPLHTTAWRRYYGARNLTVIAGLYASPFTRFYVAFVRGTRSSVALARAGRPLREVVLPIRGAIDGLLGRTGKIVDPGSARKVY